MVYLFDIGEYQNGKGNVMILGRDRIGYCPYSTVRMSGYVSYQTYLGVYTDRQPLYLV